MRSRGCGIYLLIYLLVDEGIAKLQYLKSYSTDDQSHQFVLKCPKVSSTRYCIIFYGELYYYLHFEKSLWKSMKIKMGVTLLCTVMAWK